MVSIKNNLTESDAENLGAKCFDILNELNDFILKYPNADYTKIIQLIDDSINYLNKNIQINLVFLNLIIEINKNLNKKRK